MRVTYTDSSGQVSESSTLEDAPDSAQDIQNAQIETFDEDLWAEVSGHLSSFTDERSDP